MNLRANGVNNVTVEGLALTDYAGATTLYSNRFGDSASSIIRLDSSRRAHSKIDVPTTTIDTYCSTLDLRPNFLKVDVEGAEALVIQGADSVLKRCHPIVLVEFHGFLMSEQEKVRNWKSIVAAAKSVELVTPDHIETTDGGNLLTGVPIKSDYFSALLSY
jgi:FkbM family methyltransferase